MKHVKSGRSSPKMRSPPSLFRRSSPAPAARPLPPVLRLCWGRGRGRAGHPLGVGPPGPGHPRRRTTTQTGTAMGRHAVGCPRWPWSRLGPVCGLHTARAMGAPSGSESWSWGVPGGPNPDGGVPQLDERKKFHADTWCSDDQGGESSHRACVHAEEHVDVLGRKK
jgi:hypothetical protein